MRVPADLRCPACGEDRGDQLIVTDIGLRCATCGTVHMHMRAEPLDWCRYFGDQVTPQEYLAQHGTERLKEALEADLTELWGDHPTERLAPWQIDALAQAFYRALVGG